MKNLQMLKFVLHHLKTEEKMCKYKVKKFHFLIRYVLADQYKTQQMCNKAILGKGQILKSVYNCYTNQETCNKAVDNYPHGLEFVPECNKTQKMCD